MASRKGIPNKHKPFRAALERVLDQAGRNPKLLDDIALALALKAKQGDVAAAQAIADRMDGRVPQAVVGDSDHDPVSIVVTGVPRAHDKR